MVNLGTQFGKVIIKVARRANTPPKAGPAVQPSLILFEVHHHHYQHHYHHHHVSASCQPSIAFESPRDEKSALDMRRQQQQQARALSLGVTQASYPLLTSIVGVHCGESYVHLNLLLWPLVFCFVVPLEGRHPEGAVIRGLTSGWRCLIAGLD